MQTKLQILQLALALTKAGDGDLLKSGSLLEGAGLTVEDRASVGEVGRIVDVVCRDYSYQESAIYQAEITSTSQAVIDMRAKIEATPSRRAERLEMLYSAIRRSNVDAEGLLALVKVSQQPLVHELTSLLAGLSIPDQ